MINELKIDLACGDNKKEGYFGIDIAQTSSTDAVVDLRKYPWPIESESVEELNCSHFFEHIVNENVALDLVEIVNKSNSFEEFKQNINTKDFTTPLNGVVRFINEVYRILKPGGKLYLVSPYFSSVRAFGDPTHVRFINEWSFLYFSKKWREDNKLEHYGITCDFEATTSFYISNDLALKSEEVRNKAMLHYLNTIDDIYVTLKKI